LRQKSISISYAQSRLSGVRLLLIYKLVGPFSPFLGHFIPFYYHILVFLHKIDDKQLKKYKKQSIIRKNINRPKIKNTDFAIL